MCVVGGAHDQQRDQDRDDDACDGCCGHLAGRRDGRPRDGEERRELALHGVVGDESDREDPEQRDAELLEVLAKRDQAVEACLRVQAVEFHGNGVGIETKAHLRRASEEREERSGAEDRGRFGEDRRRRGPERAGGAEPLERSEIADRASEEELEAGDELAARGDRPEHDGDGRGETADVLRARKAPLLAKFLATLVGRVE